MNLFLFSLSYTIFTETPHYNYSYKYKSNMTATIFDRGEIDFMGTKSSGLPTTRALFANKKHFGRFLL